MQSTHMGDIPVLWREPLKTSDKPTLVIWFPGFTGTKESTNEYLARLTNEGFVAISIDPVDHGERSTLDQGEELTVESGRFPSSETGHIYRHFWSIEAETAEEIPLVIDWAIASLGASEKVGVGGKSMSGDVAVVAAALDRRIEAVAACISTPDWLKPRSIYTLSAPNPKIQAKYDRLNPLTKLENYGLCPAISYQCSELDPIVPPACAQQFVNALGDTYREQPARISYVLHQAVEH